MFMSVVADVSEFPMYAELVGARVLITGLSTRVGVDIARAFAEHKGRLVLQSAEVSTEMTELAAVLAERAAEIHFYNDPDMASADIVRMVQSAAAAMGGFDLVINLATVELSDLGRERDCDAAVAAALEPMFQVTQVAANRMRLTWTEGSILNVVAAVGPATGRAGAIADMLRAMLADMTRGQAREWGGEAVRINAVGPQSSTGALLSGPSSATDADLASIALYLASAKGKKLTGHMLDAEGVAQRRCGAEVAF